MGVLMIASTSIRRKFLVFSIILFLAIFIGGSLAFFFSMRQIVHTNKKSELIQTVEIERISLDASVNGEIAIALKMADSPLVKRHFLNPADRGLQRIAFDEIEAYRQAFRSKTVFWASDIDREFYFSEENHYTVDPENPDNYWYKMTLFETEKYNFNINYNPEIKKIMLWINAPVFDSGHKPIGLVGTGIDLSEFVDSLYQRSRGNGAMYFFNNAGEITGAPDTNLIANKVLIDKELKETGREILARAKDLKAEDIYSFIFPGAAVAVGRIPALDWFITAIIPMTLSDYLSTTMTVIFLTMMAVILLIFVTFDLFIARLIKPLNKMVATLDQISGNWDLTRRFEITQKDETGTLAEFFNLTFDRMGGLLREIKNEAIALSTTGKELKSTMDHTSHAIGKINENMQNMRGMVLSQAEGANSAAVSMERINGGLDNLNSHINIQAESVAQSSSAVEQMLANIHSVTETLVKNTANINSLAVSSEAGRTDLQKVSNDIQEIARESEGLLEINSVMQNIASQTNLLSMNAAIEAAHAGESGKGFAVVADEIRKLAENSGKQSKTISAVLKKIKASIDTITKSTGIVLERFSAIEHEVTTVSNQETQIRSAMEEQETGSRYILDAVSKLNTVTNEVKNSSSQMAVTSKEILQESVNLRQLSGEVAQGMDNMAESTEMITNAVTKVEEISQVNQKNIDGLNSGISRFKT